MCAHKNPFEKFYSKKEIDVTDKDRLKKMLDDLLEMDISTKDNLLTFQDKMD